MKHSLCLVGLAAALALPARADTNAAPHVYPSGFAIALKLGANLYDSLAPDQQKRLYAVPVTLDTGDTPMIEPVSTTEDGQIENQVAISVGFIDLLNHLAHAKAIDRIEPGYFQRYVLNLAGSDTNAAIPEVPHIDDDRYWTDDVLNEQLSDFNQMFGVIIAVNFAHHYLGQYTAHAAQLPAGKPIPINGVLTPKEWDGSVRAAALNALNAGLAFDGMHALLEAFAKMPRRPAWTAFIVPQSADLRKLNTQLSKYEDDFFHGRFK